MTTKFARVFVGLAFTLMSGLISLNAFAGDEEEVTGPSLYERLGEMEGISQIVEDLIAMHHENPDRTRRLFHVSAVVGQDVF